MELYAPKQQQKVHGIILATVLENYHQDFLGKIKVSYCFGEKEKNTSGWVPVCSPYVTGEGGSYFFPEVGSQVAISFVMGHMDQPIVLGSLYNDAVKPPDRLQHEKNTVKMLRTKGGHEIIFYEEKDEERIEIRSQKGLSISFLDKEERLELTDSQKETKIVMDFKEGDITLNGKKTIHLKIGDKDVLTLDSSSATLVSNTVSIEGKQKIETNGQTTSIEGSNMELKANASFKANSSGTMELKGALVKIN